LAQKSSIRWFSQLAQAQNSVEFGKILDETREALSVEDIPVLSSFVNNGERYIYSMLSHSFVGFYP
jgi:hypothetical protein